MQLDPHFIGELLTRYLRDELTVDQASTFEEWLNESPVHRELLSEFQDDKRVAALLERMGQYDIEMAVSKWNMLIQVRPSPRIFSLKRWSIAAAILLLIGFAGYFWLNKSAPKIALPLVKHDVEAPTHQRAMITLADGSKVYLDSIKPGILATQQLMQIVKNKEGQISYRALAGINTTALVYNTLENPRGSQVIDMTLADGSRVWLNAGSSITYPVSFTGEERKVSMDGEAYFEVAHDAAHPFIVSKNNVSITVLGTHFNVNAYDDEEDIKITLLEGSVEVKKEQSTLKLTPGQQVVSHNAAFFIQNSVAIDEVMAWKNGRFELAGSTIEPIMRQIARWYNVDIAYEGEKPMDNFMGGASRQANVSAILKVLEQTHAVHFRTEGNKIIVSK